MSYHTPTTRLMASFGRLLQPLTVLFLTALLAFCAMPADAQSLSVLPDEPKELRIVFGGNENAQNFVTQINTQRVDFTYDVVTGGFSGLTLNFDDFGSGPFETTDLLSIDPLVFRVGGDIEGFKFEIQDGDGDTAVLDITGLTVAPQDVIISNSLLLTSNPAFDFNETRFIFMVVDQGNVGAGNESGTYSVEFQGGLPFELNFLPSPTGTVTVLPTGTPFVDVGGASAENFARTISDTNALIDYGLGTDQFGGATFLFDDFGTPDTNESANLSGSSHLVFGLSGDADNVKFEIEDIFTNKLSATLFNVSSSLQYYHVDLGAIAGKVDITQTRFFNLVVDTGLVGAGNETGQLFVASAGLDFPLVVAGVTGPLAPTLMPNEPSATLTGGSEPDTSVTSLSTSEFSVAYSLVDGEFGGGTILFDDFGTAPIETADFSGAGSLIFHVTGSPASVKFEIEDNMTNKASATLLGVSTSAAPFYSLSVAELSGRGVDMSKVRFMNFVIDFGLAGASPVGSFNVQVGGGLKFDFRTTPGGNTQPTLLPDEPDAQLVGGANGDSVFNLLATNRFSVGYNVTTGGFSGASIVFDDFGTAPVESSDLSGPTSFVFGVQGDPDSVKFEFVDANTNKVEGFFDGITAGLNFFQIPADFLTDNGVELTNMVLINFVVDQGLAGVGNENGSVEVRVNGLFFPFQIAGNAAGTPSIMPNEPSIIVVGGANGDTAVNQVSTSEFTAVYNVSTGGFAGATILFDDFGTGPIEVGNLQNIPNLVFYVTGAAENVKFEIEDNMTNKVSATLLDTDNAGTPYYFINSATLAGMGVDMTSIRFINFVVDQTLAGAGSAASFTVRSAGLKFDFRTSPGGNTQPSLLPDEPAAQLVGGANGDSVFSLLDTNLFSVAYNVTTGGFSGASIVFDDFGTAPVETSDLSGPTSFVFGVLGNPDTLKFEFVDADTNVVSGFFDGITGSPGFYQIPADVLTLGGLDLANVVLINFVVDQGLAGAGNEIGSFDVNVNGLFFPFQVAGGGAGTPTIMPNEPSVIVVGGANGDTTVDQVSTSTFTTVYNVSTGGFAGATILFDDFGTGPIETGNLQSFPNLVFFVTGAAENVKFEIEDNMTNKVSATLLDTDNAATPYYSINSATLASLGVDMANVRFINFVVDQTLAGAGSAASFTVRSGGLHFDFSTGSGGNTQISLLPDEPAAQLVGGANGDSVFNLLATNRFSVAYNVTTGGFSGASIVFDDFGTTPVETSDLSGPTSFVFGVSGNPDSLKFEFVDADTNVVSGFLEGITGALGFYQIPADVLTLGGLDLANVVLINFVVDQGLAGAGNENGSFEVRVNGLFFPFQVAGNAAGTPSVLPSEPSVIVVGGANGDTTVDQVSTAEFTTVYNVTTGGFAGATILFDDFGTGPIETGNLQNIPNLVFYVTGAAANVKFEIEDNMTNKVSATLLGTDNAGTPYYFINSATLASMGVDMTSIRFINFVVDQTLAGGSPAGSFTVRSGGLFMDLTLPPQGNMQLALLPDNPVVQLVGGANDDNSVFTQFSTNHFQVDYNMTTGGFSGASIIFDDFGTAPVESSDLSGPTSFVFGVQGDVDQLKFEFIDTATNRLIGFFDNVTAGLQYYQVPESAFFAAGNEISEIVAINFIVDQATAGAGNEIGSFEVFVNGLAFAPSSSGLAGPLPLTIMPNNPVATLTGGSDEDTCLIPKASNEFQVVYDVASNNFGGGTILFDDFGTGPIETADLSSEALLIFYVTGTPERVKFEIEDNMTNKTSITLIGVNTSSAPYYAIPTGPITDAGVDMANIRFMNFVIDVGLAGSGPVGAFNVRVGGSLSNPYAVAAGANTQLSLLPDKPKSQLVGGANGDNSVFTRFSTNHFSVDYNVTTGGFSGASIIFDDFGTGPVESSDLSGATSFVFAIQGDPKNLKFEFIDTNTNRAEGIFAAVQNSLGYFQIPASALTSQGLNLGQIVLINFVVDQGLAGVADLAGSFDVFVNGLFHEFNLAGAGSGIPSILPGLPEVDPIGNGDTTAQADSSTQATFVYNIATGGFSGMSIHFDDFTTPGTNESENLTPFQQIVFGLRGNSPEVKIEFKDNQDRIMNFIAGGIASTTQYYSISKALFTNDLAHMSQINFIVDQGLTSGNDAGQVVVATGGLKTDAWLINPAGSGTLSTLPAVPETINVFGGNNVSAADLLSSEKIRITYDVVAGFAGATMNFDDFGTGPSEFVNLQALGSITIAVRGDAASVKVDMEDIFTNKVSGTMVSVDANNQFYTLSMAEVSGRGVDAGRIRFISFVVDQALAGNTEGAVFVCLKGLDPAAGSLVIRSDDSDFDGIPDELELAVGMNPSDDGSGNIDNGPDGDIDLDGVDNKTEFIAGTELTNDLSFPLMDITRVDSNVMLSIPGVGQRIYEIERSLEPTGVYERIGGEMRAFGDQPIELVDLVSTEVVERLNYRTRIQRQDVSPLKGAPDVFAFAGGGGITLTTNQPNSRKVIIDYDVTGGGFAGVGLAFDDFTTPLTEFQDFSNYDTITIAVSGTPERVQVEFEDTNSVKAIATLLNVDRGTESLYVFDLSVLATNGGVNVDFSALKAIAFVVTDAIAGPPSKQTGTLCIRTWGLSFEQSPVGSATGPATPLPTPAPIVDALGGGNGGLITKVGTTNIIKDYDVNVGFDGFIINYDNFGTLELESANFANATSIVFGAFGDADRIKVEFHDTNTNTPPVLGFIDETASQQFFQFDTSDLAGAGLDLSRVRFINFVVDPGLAGGGALNGSFNVVTDGFAP